MTGTNLGWKQCGVGKGLQGRSWQDFSISCGCTAV